MGQGKVAANFKPDLRVKCLKPISLSILFAFGFQHAALAQESVQGIGPANDPTRQDDSDWMSDRWQETDVGTFLGGIIATPHQPTYQGIAIKVGKDQGAAVCFDIDLMRYSAGWSGKFLNFHPRRFGLIRPLEPAGEMVFTTLPGPGWAHSSGSLTDPRPDGIGPLPTSWAKYNGLYRHNNRVVLSYSVGSAEILESPWLESGAGVKAFTREMEVKNVTGPLHLVVASLPQGISGRVRWMKGMSIGCLEKNGSVLAVALKSQGGQVEIRNENLGVALPVSSGKHQLKLLIWSGMKTEFQRFVELAESSPGPGPLSQMRCGGRSQWSKRLITHGVIGTNQGAFAIDTLSMPYDNPWKAQMFASGHDFFSNGDIAVSTIHGDVWRVRGIDENLDRLQWKRYATGLHQPLGLRIIDDKVHVLERDRITVLHDLDGDQETDFYENLNNDCISAGGNHSFATCLETDPGGNFYFLKCAENTPHGGSLLRVSSDGSELEVMATGFRNPNGLGISPSGLITAADQQGNWVPETRLDVICKGDFYGYMPMHHRKYKPESFDGPLCWIPRRVDNSAGGQAWVPEGQWGPLSGKMIHLSYGRCTFMAVLLDEINEGAQGAVVPLPGRFVSGAMRARFSPHDEHMYVSGMRGWQTAAFREGCLQRVRYTGRNPYIPVDFSIHKNGIRIAFSARLDETAAEDSDNYSVEQWNYRWTEAYGSPDYSVAHPHEKGRDTVEIHRAHLLPDGKSVFLSMHQVKPVMQMSIRYILDTEEGEVVRGTLYTTVNQAGPKR